MWTKLEKQIAWMTDHVVAASESATEAELAALPPAARAHMRFYGVEPGRAKRRSFRMRWTGRFRLGPSRPWMPIEAVQYNTREPVTRTFHMKARMAHVLPILARDVYAGGRGHLRAELAGVVTLADGRGPELDQGELVTWLDDCVFFAPSMLLGPSARFVHVDDRAYDLVFTDYDTTVAARVFVDERGAPIDFETRDRYLEDPDDPEHPLVRACWTTPVERWQRIGDRSFPARARAVWHLATGDFAYAEFDLDASSLAFDLLPSRVAGARTARAA